MMPRSSWSIKRRKHARLLSSPTSGKRSTNFNPTRDSVLTVSKQQTLTQTERKSTSCAKSEADAELQPIAIDEKPSRLSRDYASGRIQKRRKIAQSGVLQDVEQSDPKPEPVSTSYDRDVSSSPKLLQLDGTYASPRKSRKRKPVHDLYDDGNGSEHRLSKRRRGTEHVQTHREYQNRLLAVKNTDTESNEAHTLPHQVLSDPVKNLEYFSKYLKQDELATSQVSSPPPENTVHTFTKHRDLGETENNPNRVFRVHIDSRQTRTPQRLQRVIGSSQSPETVVPSEITTPRPISLALNGHRGALQELSSNLGRLAKPIANDTSELCLSKVTTPRKHQKASPRYGTNYADRESSVEDSQASTTSILLTSPPVAGKKLPQQTRKNMKFSDKKHQLQVSSLENAASQAFVLSPSRSESDEKIYENCRFVDLKTAPADVSQIEVETGKDSQREQSLILREEALHTETTHEDNDGSLVDDSEFDDGLGSPIANDTQFNLENHEVRLGEVREDRKSKEDCRTLNWTKILQNNHQSLLEYGIYTLKREKFGSIQDNRQSLIPVPQFNAQMEFDALSNAFVQVENGSRSESVTMESEVHPSKIQTSTSQSIVENHDLLSSPTLPVTTFITQRSAHPATLPHPSQISTQSVTQGYPLLSSPHLGSYRKRQKIDSDPITIKNSSPTQPLLNQIPHHVDHGDTQVSQRFKLDQILDSDDDEDEIDLNPPSEPQIMIPTGEEIELDEDPQLGIEPRRTVQRDAESKPLHQNILPRSSQLRDDGYAEQRSDLLPSSPELPPLQFQHSPIPGFNNETQANFTQNGHVTAAYVHRQREAGVLPKWFTPQPYQVPGYTRRL